MDKTLLLATFRSVFFKGKLSTDQVAGINAILDAFEKYGTGDIRHLAYILATAYHETGGRMIAVREGQGQRKLWSDAQARRAVTLIYKRGIISRDYGKPGAHGNSFYGRGMAQITHEDNYRTMGAILGIDLVRYPDKALENDVAARILVEGSLKAVSVKGDFTAYSLESFIHDDECDYVSARRVINGDVKKNGGMIAGYARKFEAALEAADYPHKVYKTKNKRSVPVKSKFKDTPENGPIPAKRPNDEPMKPAKNVLKGIQAKLFDLGYKEVGKPDGGWGTKTASAVLAFRHDNGLQLVAQVDEEFMAALWTAAPRQVGEARATAKLVDLKGVVPGATEVDALKKGAGFLGLTSLVTGGTLSTEGLTGLTEKIEGIQNLMAVLPNPSTILVLGGAALVVYFVVTRIGSRIVASYREGQTS